MNNSIKRFVVYLVGLFISIGYLLFRYKFLKDVNDFHKEILVASAFAVIISCLTGIVEIAKAQGKYFWIALKCFLLIPNKKVYVSLSYLLRIKIPGEEKYFLVKGSKINQYQPVGGVYKLVGNKDLYKDWKASPKADGKNPRDLRFFVDAKFLPQIINWFYSRKDREIGVWREFYEELVKTQILNADNFKSIRAEFLRTKENILCKQTRFENEVYHTLIYDVFQIELSSKQSKEFNKLFKTDNFNEKYAFVTEDDIKRECFDEHKTRIGQHTKYIL
ncbi:hypothetical protein AB9K32_11800 [Allomuricauda sp. XS_ASV26]|uniref:SMODS-associated NUDIX domain-containing protein n=1 Tax=Allomuricauda sp. XS_ASV26 TaxID=3241292 RepID=UPI003519C2E4